jgi:signal transduction histidine kinase
MMETWQKQIPVAASIFTCRRDANGEIVFICCPETDLSRNNIIDGEEEVRITVGEEYGKPEEDLPEMIAAFAGKSAFNDVPTLDEWGLWVTAAEPMYDKNGNFDAVLSVDFWGEDWNAHIRKAVFWPYLFLLSFIVLFFVVQIFTIRRWIIDDRLTEYAVNLERAMDELVVAKKEADSAAQAKGLFLANMSHEIRTPLNAILGCADMLAGAHEGKQIRLKREQLADIMRKSSKNLMAIVDDVLTFSDIDMNRLALESVPVDLRQ